MGGAGGVLEVTPPPQYPPSALAVCCEKSGAREGGGGMATAESSSSCLWCIMTCDARRASCESSDLSCRMKTMSKRERSGVFMFKFSATDLFGLYRPLFGFAAATTLHRAGRVVQIPDLATLMDCCSMHSRRAASSH